MPEYLSPGVYVAEVALSARPIEGVSTSTANFVGPEVIGRLQQLVNQIPRDWTDLNDNDPGIALVELFAWLTELMIYRVQQIPERGPAAAARLAAAALTLVTDRPQSHSSVLKHVRFFEGRRCEDLAEVRGATKKKRKRKKRRKTPPSSPSSRKKLRR